MLEHLVLVRVDELFRNPRMDVNMHCEGVSNIITLLRYPVFCISGTSLLGTQGQICFFEFLEIISSFFAQNFCTDRVDILLCSEKKKTGGFSSKFGTLAPSKYCGRRRQARPRLRPRRVWFSVFIRYGMRFVRPMLNSPLESTLTFSQSDLVISSLA